MRKATISLLVILGLGISGAQFAIGQVPSADAAPTAYWTSDGHWVCGKCAQKPFLRPEHIDFFKNYFAMIEGLFGSGSSPRPPGIQKGLCLGCRKRYAPAKEPTPKPPDKVKPKSPKMAAPHPPKTPEFAPPAVPEPSEPMPPTDSELLTPEKKTVGDALLEYAQLAQKGQQPSQSLEEFIESFTGAPHSAPGPGAQTPLSHQELLETYLAHQSESPAGWKEAAFEKATQPLVDMSEVLAELVLAAVPEQQAVVPSVEEVDAQVADCFGFDVADSDAPETKATLDVQRELMDALLQKDVSPDDIREALPADLREKIADDPEGVFGAHWHLLREMLPEEVQEIGDKLQDVAETFQTARRLADQNEPGAAVLYLMLKGASKFVDTLSYLPLGVSETLALGAELVPAAVQAGQTIQTFGLDEGRVSLRQHGHPINQILQNHTGTARDELRVDTPDGPRIIRVAEWDTVEIDGETFYLTLDDKDSPTGILVKHQPAGRWRFWDTGKVTVYQADTSGSPLRGYTIGSVREAKVLEPQR